MKDMKGAGRDARAVWDLDGGGSLHFKSWIALRAGSDILLASYNFSQIGLLSVLFQSRNSEFQSLRKLKQNTPAQKQIKILDLTLCDAGASSEGL